MGGKISVPEQDANILKCMKLFRLTEEEISDFWKIFQKLDNEKTGLVPLTAIFESFKYKRNLYTDCLLELLEIEHDGEINFSDFLLMVNTYCFFETREILRFCFYCFDQDRTGFISVEDMDTLMYILHNVKAGDKVHGNIKESREKLEFKGDPPQIDFEEFALIHTKYPRIFEPAFSLQQLMMIYTLGELWWTRKKRENQDIRDEADRKIAKQKAKKNNKKTAKKNRQIRRNMGLIKYYFCPCYRALYDPANSETAHLSAEEKVEREKQIALRRRKAELDLKNPVTAEWLKYEKKVAPDLAALDYVPEETGVVALANNNSNSMEDQNQLLVVQEMKDSKTFLDQKVLTTARPREERAYNRAERRKQRKKVDLL
jgi:Ca2+-binding EF-hand superfamily protein